MYYKMEKYTIVSQDAKTIRKDLKLTCEEKISARNEKVCPHWQKLYERFSDDEKKEYACNHPQFMTALRQKYPLLRLYILDMHIMTYVDTQNKIIYIDFHYSEPKDNLQSNMKL